MGLLGLFGSVSLDHQQKRLAEVRAMLMKQLRRQLGLIQRDVEQSAAGFQDLLRRIQPELADLFAARTGLGRMQAEAVRSMYEAAKQFAPETMAARAREDVAAAFDIEKFNNAQQLSRLGIDPTTVRATALDRGLDVARAAETARAGTLGRLVGAEQQARMNALALGADQQSLGGALQPLAGLYGNIAGLRSSVLGNPLQQAGAVASLIGQEANMKLAEGATKANALNSLMGTVFGATGLGAGLYMMNQPTALDKLLDAAKSTPGGVGALFDALAGRR